MAGRGRTGLRMVSHLTETTEGASAQTSVTQIPLSFYATSAHLRNIHRWSGTFNVSKIPVCILYAVCMYACMHVRPNGLVLSVLSLAQIEIELPLPLALFFLAQRHELEGGEKQTILKQMRWLLIWNSVCNHKWQMNQLFFIHARQKKHVSKHQDWLKI